MTDVAQPGGIDTTGINNEIADTLGRFPPGFIVPASAPTASARESPVDETAFDEFSIIETSDGGANFAPNVEIAAGEAFVSGWIATDETRTVELAEDQTAQPIYLAWDYSAVGTDSIIIGTESDIDLAGAVELPKMAIHEVDTDGFEIAETRDLRHIGPYLELDGADIGEVDTTQLSVDGNATVTGSATVEGDLNAESNISVGGDVDGVDISAHAADEEAHHDVATPGIGIDMTPPDQTIHHADTSDVLDINSPEGEAIVAINFDEFGHVIGASTGEPITDEDITQQAVKHDQNLYPGLFGGI